MASACQTLNGSFSTGHLMRLFSQASEDNGLLSLTAVERMRDSGQQTDDGCWATSASFASKLRPKSNPIPLSVGLGTSGSWLQIGQEKRPSTSGSYAGNSGSKTPVRRRMVWSDPLDLPVGSRHDRGVSSCTKRENCSQEQVSVKLDSSLVIDRKGMHVEQATAQLSTAPPESPGSNKQKMETIAARFNDEVTAVESQIADLGKSLQLNNFLKDDESDVEAKAQEEREAAKKRREVEIRKARLKEKSARDPHRKVKLRLENKRRFDMDSLDETGIPTTKVTFRGLKGCENMRLVDVQALRSKCHGLTEGIHSVHKLVEMQQRKDVMHVSLMRPSSTPSLHTASMFSEDHFPARPSLHSASALPRGRWKPRPQRA